MAKNKDIISRPKDLEISIFTLWSIFILIDQHFKALGKYRLLLESEYDYDEFEDGMYIDSIREALYYQILLKTCSFIEEWDEIFGIKTEQEYKKTIIEIKKIVKPARKLLNTFKDLKQFRNQAIAHNHRDEKGNNIYFSRKSFHTPQNLADLALLIYGIEKMVKVLAGVLYNEFQRAITKPFSTGFKYSYGRYKYLTKEEFIDQVNLIDDKIRMSLKGKYDFDDVSSDYGELLRTAP